MENPSEFDIWCKLAEGGVKAAAMWTANIHSIALLDAYKVVRASVNQDGYVQIFVGAGWDDISRLRHGLPDFVQQGSGIVTVSSYRPSACTGFCEKHLLQDVGQTCPVCEGIYISRVVDGRDLSIERV